MISISNFVEYFSIKILFFWYLLNSIQFCNRVTRFLSDLKQLMKNLKNDYGILTSHLISVVGFDSYIL